MRVRINLEAVCRYLCGIPARRQDGLKQALEAKAQELGIAAGTAIVPETTLGEVPTGNLAGVLRFVQSVQPDSPEEDQQAIATLLATVKANFAAAGYVDPPPAAAEEQAAPMGPAKARRAARRSARRTRK